MTDDPTIGLTVGDSLGRIYEFGPSYEFVEFGIAEGPLPDPVANPRALREAVDDADTALCVHLPFSQDLVTPVSEINDAIIEYLSHLLSWAAEANAEKAVLHATARNPHDVDLRELLGKQLRRVNSHATDVGIELVIENVGHQKRGVQLSVLGDYAEKTDTAVCFDVGHAYMEDGMDGITRFLKQYRSCISHLHVHDARTRGDTHLPIGAGEIDYHVIAHYLEGFPGTVAVEVFTDDTMLLADTANRIEAHLYHS